MKITLEKDSIWHVDGSFKTRNLFGSTSGGVLHVKIRKADAKVLHVIHGK